ncbi:hypothetical protein CYJ41_04630 [Campylobacter ureolyticus]|uniref:Uncharacterized protein n=1 Tax=Campylobacter ureolyticus TaxID=827 RepID=A0A2I1N9R7_9BACT|nr:hypothetical protein CYJ41_04630 [Campylobacter ureolyticus]
MDIFSILNIITIISLLFSIIFFMFNIKSKINHILFTLILFMSFCCFFIFLKIDEGFIRNKGVMYVLFFIFFYAFLDALKRK